MRQASRSKIVLAIFLVFSQSLLGCSTEKRHTFPVEEPGLDERLEARIVPQDTHGLILKRVLGDARVRACGQGFAAMGLEQDPLRSFSIRGVTGSGDAVTVTILTFVGRDSSVAGLLAYAEDSRAQNRVFPCVVASEQGSVYSGEVNFSLAEYAITERGVLVPFSVASSNLTGDEENGGFWECVGRSTIAGVLWCTVKCRPFGPYYADCLVGCVAAAFLVAMIGCFFTEVL